LGRGGQLGEGEATPLTPHPSLPLTPPSCLSHPSLPLLPKGERIIIIIQRGRGGEEG